MIFVVEKLEILKSAAYIDWIGYNIELWIV